MAYEFDGKKYKKASSHQKEWGARIIAELALQGNERVLDLGCGDGELTLRLAELLPQGNVVGIDASQGMIDTARPNEEAMIQWIDQPSLVPFLARIADKNKKSSFREVVARRMIEETKENDGRCFETFRRINVSARKKA